MKNDEPSFLRLEREVELKVVCPPLLSDYKRLQFENQKLRYRVAELEGEESSGARWKRFPFLIMGLVFIAFGGWLFGRTIELSNEQIVGLVSALYFICVGQIYLAEFQKRSDDK